MQWLLDLFQSIVFQTVMSGVLVFTFSEILQKFFLDPWKKYKTIEAKIDNQLKFYQYLITHPGISTVMMRKDELDKECSSNLRKLSCELEASYKQISCSKLRGLIRSKEKVSNAASLLIGISNNMFRQDDGAHNYADVKKIREDLDIRAL